MNTNLASELYQQLIKMLFTLNGGAMIATMALMGQLRAAGLDVGIGAKVGLGLFLLGLICTWLNLAVYALVKHPRNRGGKDVEDVTENILFTIMFIAFLSFLLGAVSAALSFF